MSEKAKEAAKKIEVLCARLEALQAQMLESEVAEKRVVEAAHGAREHLQMLADEIRAADDPDIDPPEDDVDAIAMGRAVAGCSGRGSAGDFGVVCRGRAFTA